MKNLIIVFLTLAPLIGLSQSSEFESYELLTNVPITECRVIANFKGKKSELGSVESIKDEVVMLQIAKGKSYTVIINDDMIFDINKDNSINSSDSNDAMASSNESKGLVYRVQVGAYSKKLKKGLFSEFEDLHIEKITNTKITRYMVGTYFSKSEVMKVLRDIKQDGYSDAFVVAYYDGMRK